MPNSHAIYDRYLDDYSLSWSAPLRKVLPAYLHTLETSFLTERDLTCLQLISIEALTGDDVDLVCLNQHEFPNVRELSLTIFRSGKIVWTNLPNFRELTLRVFETINDLEGLSVPAQVRVTLHMDCLLHEAVDGIVSAGLQSQVRTLSLTDIIEYEDCVEGLSLQPLTALTNLEVLVYEFSSPPPGKCDIYVSNYASMNALQRVVVRYSELLCGQTHTYIGAIEEQGWLTYEEGYQLIAERT